MSKLIRQIEQLGKNEGPKIGFGFKKSKSNPPSMVLIATTKEPLKKMSPNGYPIDAIVFIQSSSGIDDSITENELDSLVIGLEANEINTTEINDKIDFILINNHSIELEQLNKDELGRILVISEKFLKDHVTGLETLPVDAILLKESLSSPITLEKLLHISALRTDINLPFLVKLETKPSKWELDCLDEIGVQGIVADLSNFTELEFIEISNNLKIPKKRKSQKINSALLPSASTTDEYDDEVYDDDYDDDDDYVV